MSQPPHLGSKPAQVDQVAHSLGEILALYDHLLVVLPQFAEVREVEGGGVFELATMAEGVLALITEQIEFYAGATMRPLSPLKLQHAREDAALRGFTPNTTDVRLKAEIAALQGVLRGISAAALGAISDPLSVLALQDC